MKRTRTARLSSSETPQRFAAEALEARIDEPSPVLGNAMSALPSLEDEIRARAYQIYEERGREEGHAAEDWYQAEREILRRQGQAA